MVRIKNTSMQRIVIGTKDFITGHTVSVKGSGDGKTVFFYKKVNPTVQSDGFMESVIQISSATFVAEDFQFTYIPVLPSFLKKSTIMMTSTFMTKKVTMSKKKRYDEDGFDTGFEARSDQYDDDGYEKVEYIITPYV
jgi:hypothetical protein